ncbi:polyphosphate kinase 1 [Rubritalea marina]|uniref:polyphosphate kinase 1 n=1 Tax=Rubritalea marina TaxID=361055 RepID=UPI00035C90DB|nr:polyphosphate kinase 1 [Rubritalea marina]
MPSSSYINRELSWIEFNQRVLSEAQRPEKPLLERVKFLAISASNLDEFFQVRVGGLTLLKSAGSRTKDIAGMTPLQQLNAIRKRISQHITDQYTLYTDTLLPALHEQEIHISSVNAVDPSLVDNLKERFIEEVLPLLSPIAYEDTSKDDDAFPAPILPAMTLIVACELSIKNKAKSKRVVFVPITEIIERFIHIDKGSARYAIPVEDLICHFISELFPSESLHSHGVFRITRNGDIAVQEEDAIDLAGEMEEVLSARKTSNTVRLEVQSGCSRVIEKVIKQVTLAAPEQIYRIHGPLALSDFMQFAFIPGHDTLKSVQWEPQSPPSIDYANSIFDEISKKDIFLYHPYHSFDPVVRLLEEAASDDQVLSIKQVLYRTAKNSRIIDALIRAAHNGKQVTVLVELKARFDEARNLLRAEELQRAGVQIVYGVKGLKTHAKITLVIRKENNSIKRYCHFGTGNYNESTAKLYTDASILTAREDFGTDASLIFNAITGRSKLLQTKRILPAPTHMKKRILQLINSEAARAKAGEKASITAKVNSLQDKDIINALYNASKQGVKIRLNIRGICCLKPGKRNEAKNIEVISVIDYYLEHARIFQFYAGGKKLTFISSADWMTRNLEKRIELMVPIVDKKIKAALTEILDAAFLDNQQAHRILTDGDSQRVENKKERFRMQEHLQATAEKAAKTQTRKRNTTFEAHKPHD